MNSDTPSFKDLTTFRVGGNIRTVVHAKMTQEIIDAVKDADQKKIPLIILGGGSNILPRDEPFEGIVVVVETKDVLYEEAENSVRIIADAGVVWDELVEETVRRGLWGFENLSGIPGSVGAAPIQNIGAYGTDIAKTVAWVEVYDRHQQNIRVLQSTELAFEYRNSFLKKNPQQFAVLRVAFMLQKEGVPNISYKDLALRFGDETPTLENIRSAVLEIRHTKFPDLRIFGTAGSFFMNPILTQEEFSFVQTIFPDIPNFPEALGTKISLAWLLDRMNLKGFRVGGARVWENQPLVIVTDTSATAHDVRALATQIQEKIFARTHIRITPEVNIF